VASIHPDLSTVDIQSVFEAFGKIDKIVLAPGREVDGLLFCMALHVRSDELIKGTGNHRCYGWIDFAAPKSVDEAVAAMNNFDLGGQFLRVRRGVR
jgi:RNA recognition motif-containing protein